MLNNKRIENIEKHLSMLEEHNNSLDAEISVLRNEIAKLMEIMQKADKSYKEVVMRLISVENRLASIEVKR